MVLIGPQLLTAQSPNPRVLDAGPLILELPVSTRALGLGGAFVGADDDSDAVFHDPALISASGFGASYQRFGSGGTHAAVAGGGAWYGGFVGIGLAFLEYGAPSDDPAALLRDPGALSVGGGVAASEFIASLGLARQIAGVLAGATVKAVGQRLGPSRGSSVAIDLGVAVDMGWATVALAAQNLGPDLELAGETRALAKRVGLTASTRRTPLGPLDIGGAAQLSRNGSGELIPGAGVEISWWPVVGRTFIGRFGLARVVDGSASPLHVGGGFAGDRIRLDYAYQAYDGLEAAHRFGVAFR